MESEVQCRVEYLKMVMRWNEETIKSIQESNRKAQEEIDLLTETQPLLFEDFELIYKPEDAV